MARRPAHPALVLVHAPRLDAVVPSAQRVRRMLRAASPDHRFENMLEEHREFQIREVTGWRKMVHYRSVETLPTDQFFQILPHARRMKALHGHGSRRNQPSHEFYPEGPGPLI